MRKELAAVAAYHGGPFTRKEALSYGYSPKAIQHKLSVGQWHRLRAGIYADAAVVRTSAVDPACRHALEVAAVVLAFDCAEAAGSHHSAAKMYGFDMLREPPDQVTVTCPPAVGDRAARMGFRLHFAGLPSAQVRVRYGVPVTSPARTVVDLARLVTHDEAVVAADAALRRQYTSRAELEEVLSTCRGWPGIRRAARAVAFADPLAESVLESLGRVFFARYGLPVPKTQVVLGGAGEVIGRGDFYWPEYGVVGEADGMFKYSNLPQALRAEKLRQERLEDAGYVVIRFTWHDIAYRPEQTARRIRAAFARGAAKRERR